MRQIFAGKWRFAVIRELLKGPQRLSELERAIPQATKKMLIEVLRLLESLTWLGREEDIEQGRRRVVYALKETLHAQIARLIEPIQFE